MKTYYALILGASSGFGKAIATALAKDGTNIIGVHLDRAQTMPLVEDTIAGIKDTGAEAHFFNTNAANEYGRTNVLDSVQKIFSEKDNPTIKVLVHSLAFGTLRSYIDDDLKKEINQKQMEMTLDVMANSLVYWTQDVIRRKLMNKGGKIFALTSAGGTKVIKYYGAVSAAKACLESHIRQLAAELGEMGITANALKAGVTDTPALKKIPNRDKLIENAIKRSPSRRLTLASDIAEFILEVYKNDSNWMTGNVINIDGGESIIEL
jgi:NAD(P)-dependent dehydrogenase (short-subunit alcohol dehydrogenase family)